MQPRLAALLFALGLVDLAYVNLGLGHEVLAEQAASELDEAPTDPSTPPDDPPPSASPPAPAILPLPIEPSPSIEPPPSSVAPETSVTLPTPTQTGAASTPAATEPEPAAAAPAADTGRVPAQLEADPGWAEERPSIERPTTDAERAAASDILVGFPNTASWVLTARAREELLVLAAQLREHPEYRVRIVGHADARGSREFNRDLGSRRARAVSELLARAGVRREQIEAATRGEDEPRATGATERVWAANRRVEISVESARSETP
jgi:outer membrane protein OmpA-like peptidoglycan-associated protein